MKLALFLALAGWCGAQTLTLGCARPPAGAKALACTISFTSGAGLSPAAQIQGTITSTPALGAITATIAGTAASAGKVISVSGNSFIIGGNSSASGMPPLNATPMADGLVANLTIAIPTGLTGNVTLTLAGGALVPFASSASGSGFALTPNPALSVSILGTNFCDIDGNGQVNQADVAAEQVLVFSQSPKGIRGSGSSPSVTDLQIVVNAALPGGTCMATQ